ncbi:MAG: hypothetical protein R3A10_07825 [Caldilineaceae bacterium]
MQRTPQDCSTIWRKPHPGATHQRDRRHAHRARGAASSALRRTRSSRRCCFWWSTRRGRRRCSRRGHQQRRKPRTNARWPTTSTWARSASSWPPAEVVLELLGYPAGGVLPFGHRTDLPVILDAPAAATGAPHDGVIYGGGGDDRTMMRLTVDELCRGCPTSWR